MLSGSIGTTGYQYEVNTDPDAASNVNDWLNETIETPGDSSKVTTFYNCLGDKLLTDTWNGQSGTAAKHSITYTMYDDNGNVIETAQPSAINTSVETTVNGTQEYGHDSSQANLGVSLNSDTGLIQVNAYYTSTATSFPGGVEGYLRPAASSMVARAPPFGKAPWTTSPTRSTG